MKKLTQKRLKELLAYDPDTGVFTRLTRRGGREAGSVAGAINQRGYITISIDGKRYYAHRLSWLYVHGYTPENDLDHIDKNKSNNRIENLREASRQCNMRNIGNRRDNTSGVKGISWYKPYNKWLAHIRINGKDKHLGYYENFDDAVRARHQAEKAANWSGCDSSSPAYQYLRDNNLLNQKRQEAENERVFEETI